MVVSLTRETEVKEKDEGSLSIPIVPIEIRETIDRWKPVSREGKILSEMTGGCR